jgi:hypothetical protein
MFDNNNDSRNSDTDIINQKLLLQEDKYIDYKPLKIFCGTYNVAAHDPDESLAPWLQISNDTEIDIYAIGFQEIVDLNTTSLLFQQNWDEKEMYWTNYINEILLSPKLKRKYKQVQRGRMFGLYLLLYADVKLCEKAITEIYTSYVATGILSVGNKGSVAISLKLYETRFCFVCSHFAAHTENVEKRNSDFKTTRQQLKFQDTDKHSNPIDLSQHDTVFWFGDFNYRIDAISLNDTMKLVNSNSFEQLLKYDQLTTERAHGRVFEAYSESPVTFRPTYKYLIKTDLYEKQATGQSLAEHDAIGKVKLPSWTDRVLWKSSEKVQVLQYSSVSTLTISDHKPVLALFATFFRQIDESKLKKLIEKLHKESDKKLNEEMPHISVESKEFKFGECMYYDVKTAQLSIKNDGLTKCNVELLFHDPDVVEPATASTNKTQTYVMRARHVTKLKSLNQWVDIFPQYKEKIPANTIYSIELATSFNSFNLSRLNKLANSKQRLIEEF